MLVGGFVKGGINGRRHFDMRMAHGKHPEYKIDLCPPGRAARNSTYSRYSPELDHSEQNMNKILEVKQFFRFDGSAQRILRRRI